MKKFLIEGLLLICGICFALEMNLNPPLKLSNCYFIGSKFQQNKKHQIQPSTEGYVPDYHIAPQPELNDWIQAIMPYTPSELGLNSYTSGAAHGEGDSAFNGAIIISDSECVLIPVNSDYIGLYNYRTDTYTRGPAHGRGDGAFAGGVLLDDGRVILCPQNSDYVGIYTPSTNSYSNGPSTGLADTRLISGCLLPSGNMYLSSYQDQYGIYNPTTNTLAT